MLRPNARSPSITSQESYSAIMITDLVADVPVNPPEAEQENAKPTKDVTNLAYDDHMDGGTTSPVLKDVNSSEIKGSSLSKGIILNAVQFGQSDKTKLDEKPIPLTASLPVPDLPQQTSEPKGFKDMSIQRKIAFGFSFLPSVLFVLCFAVILPCNVPKSCVEDVWIVEFNNTEPTSTLEISDNIMLTAIKNGENVLMELEINSGNAKDIKLPTNSAYLKCGKIMNKDKTDCIIMDISGKIYDFSNSEGKMLWDPVSETSITPSFPVLLSGCSGDELDIAVAVSNTNIKVLHDGNKVSNFNVSLCDSVPEKLMSWTANGSSDIVFVCDKDGEDRLVKVPKTVWCISSKNPQDKPVILQTGDLNSIKNSILQPLEDGLVLWSEREVSMIAPDGFLLWKVTHLSNVISCSITKLLNC